MSFIFKGIQITVALRTPPLSTRYARSVVLHWWPCAGDLSRPASWTTPFFNEFNRVSFRRAGLAPKSSVSVTCLRSALLEAPTWFVFTAAHLWFGTNIKAENDRFGVKAEVCVVGTAMLVTMVTYLLLFVFAHDFLASRFDVTECVVLGTSFTLRFSKIG